MIKDFALSIAKAIVAFAFSAFAVLLAQQGVDTPAEVVDAIIVIENWLIPLVAGLITGLITWAVPNKP